MGTSLLALAKSIYFNLSIASLVKSFSGKGGNILTSKYATRNERVVRELKQRRRQPPQRRPEVKSTEIEVTMSVSSSCRPGTCRRREIEWLGVVWRTWVSFLI